MAELHSSNHRFHSPPVFETAVTVQFEELPKFRGVHYGQFFPLISDQFPIAEDKPRVDPILERFPRRFDTPHFQFLQKTHGAERVWFRDQPNGAHLVQLQPDRLSLNWRKGSGSDRYPPFEENGPLFLDIYGKFQEFAATHELGEVQPNLSEVVYVNHIFPAQGESAIQCFGRIFAGLEWKQTDDFLPQPEIAFLNRVYEIGQSQGRLYAEAGIAKHSELGEFVQLKITARVLIGSAGDVVGSLQMAHDWVANGFVSLTTEDAQRTRWKRG